VPIDTPQQLREHLRLAIQVELSTIPPYLFAMYSIEDQSSDAALLIRSIVAEEMLHAALAANVLLAVGGEPAFAAVDLMTTYPSLLPHHRPPLELRLAPCSPELVRDVLMRIEQPQVHEAAPEPDSYETLGQFYHALEIAITELSATDDLFTNPQADRQLADPTAYRPVAFDAADSGGLMLVDSAASAREALEVIVHQGEGLSNERWADPSHQELTHYSKLLRIADGLSPLGAVVPMRSNPRTADFPDGVQVLSNLFNASYRYLFILLDTIFSPWGDKTAVAKMYSVMSEVLAPLGRLLVQQPLDGGEFAGPTFEIYDFDAGDPASKLAELAASAAVGFPEVAATHEALRHLGSG
jgi:rubrerythrin